MFLSDNDSYDQIRIYIMSDKNAYYVQVRI